MNSQIQQAIIDLAAQEHGPFYFYDEGGIIRQIRQLQSHMGTFALLYSIKTNPFPPVVKSIMQHGVGADAASAGEVEMAVSWGASPHEIFYSAPGKTRQELDKTLDKCTVIADSLGELQLLNAIARERGICAAVGVRVNPNFSMFGPTGESSKFGIDEEQLHANADHLRTFSHLSIAGIHVHLRSQVLEDAVLLHYYRRICAMAVELTASFGWKLTFLNFGGGLGIPYGITTGQALNTAKLGEMARKLHADYPSLYNVRLYAETGRFLVCEAGWYVTPVVDRKESRGTKYLIVQNTLNGFIRPSLAALVEAAAPCASDSFSAEPLYTKPQAFEVQLLEKRDVPHEPMSVVGNLCTANDILAANVLLPSSAAVGNHIVVSHAGSYAYTLSPLGFSSHPAPRQYLWCGGRRFLSE